MKKLFGIGILALALSTTVGCAARGYGRLGPPPPPPPPHEAMMYNTYPGRVWVPGYYRWTGYRYKWVKGRWVKPPRRGQVWVPGHHAPQRGGYVWVEGNWR